MRVGQPKRIYEKREELNFGSSYVFFLPLSLALGKFG